LSKPVVRARDEFAEAEEPGLGSLVDAWLERQRLVTWVATDLGHGHPVECRVAAPSRRLAALSGVATVSEQSIAPGPAHRVEIPRPWQSCCRSSRRALMR